MIHMFQMIVALILVTSALPAAEAADSVPVTVDNFVRAESDTYFAGGVRQGGFGKFIHRRELVPISSQPVIRSNRDTLYSSAVFDLDAGPVTVALPDSGKRFMSMMVVDEDHHVADVIYGSGDHTLTREGIGTRYVVAIVRTLVDPRDPQDMQQAHALQDAIKAQQKNLGTFEIPQWDPVSQKQVRDALLVLGSTVPDLEGAFGSKVEVDPIRHLIGTALAWGGNPEKDATYLSITPAVNDGKTAYRLQVREVPVDAFWSISVYNAKGYFEANPFNAYALNSITARKGGDGSIEVLFGDCDGKIPNCLPIMDGWNYTVRMYRPHVEILDGTWHFPAAQPVK